MESLQSRHADSSLQDRVVTTLRIADRWGYGLAGEEVSSLLYGGPESGADVSSTLVGSASVIFRDGIAALRGREDLIEKCLARRRSNGALAGTYFRIADDFARDLLRHSPFVRAIAVCGSTASGGIEAGDDVDFNLFAEDGTNDPRIPKFLERFLARHFRAVFFTSPPRYTTRKSSPSALGRIEIHDDTSTNELYRALDVRMPASAEKAAELGLGE